jgi:hypothetical protein
MISCQTFHLRLNFALCSDFEYCITMEILVSYRHRRRLITEVAPFLYNEMSLPSWLDHRCTVFSLPSSSGEFFCLSNHVSDAMMWNQRWNERWVWDDGSMKKITFWTHSGWNLPLEESEIDRVSGWGLRWEMGCGLLRDALEDISL